MITQIFAELKKKGNKIQDTIDLKVETIMSPKIFISLIIMYWHTYRGRIIYVNIFKFFYI